MARYVNLGLRRSTMGRRAEIGEDCSVMGSDVTRPDTWRLPRACKQRIRGPRDMRGVNLARTRTRGLSALPPIITSSILLIIRTSLMSRPRPGLDPGTVLYLAAHVLSDLIVSPRLRAAGRVRSWSPMTQTARLPMSVVQMIPVDRTGCTLLLHRSPNVPVPNTWGFPTGTHEFLETMHDTCSRELLEEFNLRALAPVDRKSTRLNSSHSQQSRMPSSA